MPPRPSTLSISYPGTETVPGPRSGTAPIGSVPWPDTNAAVFLSKTDELCAKSLVASGAVGAAFGSRWVGRRGSLSFGDGIDHHPLRSRGRRQAAVRHFP